MHLFSKIWRKIVPDLVVQRRIHDTLFALSLKDHLFFIKKGNKADAEHVPFPIKGHVWDLGCNIGLYSVEAAKMGCRVSSFDISLINILCLKQTARLNDLDITTFFTPVTVEKILWSPACSGHTEETLKITGNGIYCSLDFLEASEKSGKPDFIKMDIQGGEAAFLKSKEFYRWIMDNRISLYLETHNNSHELLWPEFKKIDNNHFMINI